MAVAESSEALNEARYAAYLAGSYHADREGVLDRRHRWMMFGVVALGALSIVNAMGRDASGWFGVATALIGAADLTFNFTGRARVHAHMRREYFRIAAQIEHRNYTRPQADAKLMELAAEEEPIYMAAHALAANWATKAVYGDARPLPCHVGRWPRLFRHWFRMTEADFGRPRVGATS